MVFRKKCFPPQHDARQKEFGELLQHDILHTESYTILCQFFLQFIVGCVQSSSNEITLLETDSTDDITVAQIQYGIASVRSAEISGFDSKAFIKFITEFSGLLLV